MRLAHCFAKVIITRGMSRLKQTNNDDSCNIHNSSNSVFLSRAQLKLASPHRSAPASVSHRSAKLGTTTWVTLPTPSKHFIFIDSRETWSPVRGEKSKFI